MDDFAIGVISNLTTCLSYGRIKANKIRRSANVFHIVISGRGRSSTFKGR